MKILIINCGSSSIKASIIDHQSGERSGDLKVQRLGEEGCTLEINGKSEALTATNHQDALAIAIPKLLENFEGELAAVGHRVVHGGEQFQKPTIIDDEVEKVIESLFKVAPLHNPPNLAGIRAAKKLLSCPHIAVFDTAFHSTLPKRAKTYAIDTEIANDLGLRRYGFHGVSHAYVSKVAAAHMESDRRDLRIITCHLGNGCSVAAVEYGRSIETSMGMTPLEGLVMGTRSGDIDPGIILELFRSGKTVDEVDEILNRRSGLSGLSGIGNDLRDIEERASEGDENCRLAIQVFAHRVRKYIGAYAAAMGGVDAIVFTAGIGENSVMMRHRIAQRLDFLGAVFWEDHNRDVSLSAENPVAEISTRNSRCRLLVVKTDEEKQIAIESAKLVLEMNTTKGDLEIPVAVSARHVHLTQETVEALFGEGYQLTERNPLSQPNQFACNETVSIVGPKRTLENVRILGPTRPKNQVEISRTDEFFLGIDAPVRASGDVDNSPGCTLIGTDGRRIELKQGVICAWRHIHMQPEDAEKFGVQDRDVVEIAIQSNGRKLTFGDVLVRVKSSYKLEMHIDTDEGNAAELARGGAQGVLVNVEGLASMRTRLTKHDQV